jgi:hypothetical protein
MAPAMSSIARSEATAAPVAAEAERKSAPAARGALPDMVLRMQRTAGNAAVARAVAPATQSIQRCGANCGCATCGGKEEELLDDEKLGAGLLRSAVANRSA